MLMADGGELLRDVIARERSLDRWLEVLPFYAQLQLAAAGDVDALAAAGVPHRRLDDLTSEYATCSRRCRDSHRARARASAAYSPK